MEVKKPLEWRITDVYTSVFMRDRRRAVSRTAEIVDTALDESIREGHVERIR